MGKEKIIIKWVLFIFLMAITPYVYGIVNTVNSSYLENYFFNSKLNDHFFAFSKNQYFEITPSGLKIWTWNPIKNSFCEPVEIHFINNESNVILGSEEADISYSYYSGNDPNHWIIDDYAYKKLCVPNVYNGIDLEFYFREHELEFDFLVNSQADIDQIIWNIRGNIDSYIEDNKLHIVNKEGYIYTFSIPEIYRSTIKNPNDISEFSAYFSILDKHTYQITIDGFDGNSELTIDPILTLSTYIVIPSANTPSSLYSKACLDYYNSITDIALIGGTIELPGLTETTSVFLCKVSPTLGKAYKIVFLNGNGDELINTITHYTSSTDNFVILGGKTNSSNFPIANPVLPFNPLLNGNGTSTNFDGFLVVFDNDLSIVFSTFIGGMGDDSIDDITIDDNNLCFAGNTNSIDLPFVNSSINYTKEIFSDGFWGVLRLTKPLEYRYLTKLNIEGIEIKNIEAKASVLYLCGNTTVGLPYFNPVILETSVQGKDIFVQTYSYVDGTTTPDVSLLSSIFFGGSNDDIVEGSVLIYSNTLCLAGNTYSNDMPGPIISPIPEQILGDTKPFITLVNPISQQKLIGTHYIFGDGIDVITDIKTPNKNQNTFFISGYTNSKFESFVGVNLAAFTASPFNTLLNQGMSNNKNLDAMIWRLEWDSIKNTISTTWGTFLGGTGNETALSIGVADLNYICLSGVTDSPDFPLQGCQPITSTYYLPAYYISTFNIPGKVIYVNPESSADPLDGSSWEKGFHTISEALNFVSNNDEIWVKSGEYRETLTISALSNVKLRGGFLGNEYNIGNQDPWKKPTKVIPILHKGTGNLGTPTMSITDSMGIEINGLIFENGNNILGDGGAIHIYNSLVNIVSSQFYANKAYGAGGAVYVDNSYAEIKNCVFVNNTCQSNGSAISANESTLKIIHCSFANNRITSPSIEISTVDIQGSTSMLFILNSIIWAKEGNTQVQVNYHENIPTTNFLFSHSIIQNFGKLSSPPPSEMVLDTDPLFIENPEETTKGDLNLSIESPAINLGAPISLHFEYGAVNEDIRKKPRILMGENCKPDAGAFEIFPPPPPQITLFGDNPLYIGVNEPYVEPGYESKDGCNVDITSLVDINSNVNIEQVGEYTVEYSVINPYDQEHVVSVTRRVIVISGFDQIILIGSSDIVLECGQYFDDPGAVAFDSRGNDISNEIIVEGNVDYNKPGTYTIKYRVDATETHGSFSVERNVTVQDTTPPILVLIGPQQITVPCGSTWSEPGYIAFDRCSITNVSVTGNVYTNTTGTYEITYTAYDAYEHSSVLTRRVIVDCNIPQLQQCINQCSNDMTSIDDDGDGLTLCVESCLKTSDQDTDTDDDGMPDNFEVSYTLNPLSNDAKEDADLDGLLNLEEFLMKTDPIDSNSPWETHYVSNFGNDDNPGTLSSPRATITVTLEDISRNAIVNQNKQSIVLFPGDYYEDIALSENIILIGITASGENNRAVIYGHITGANGAKIYNVDIQPNTNPSMVNPVKVKGENTILLNCGNTSMHIRNVRFIGTGSEIGISLEGGNPYSTIIERCLFQDLNIAILIGDSIPIIRRCVFKSTLSTKTTPVGIYIEDNSESSNPSNSLGDVNDSNTGWNTFNLEGGKAIVSEREDKIKAHNNDWGTENTGEISNQIQGNLDTQYYLGRGKAIIASSLACVVWNATNREPVINATVSITPSIYPPLTQNTNGVYTFSSIPSGTYTVRITAPNFDTRQIVTDVPEGELKSEPVALTPTISIEGEGSADGEGNVEGSIEGNPEGSVEGEPSVKIPDVRGKSREEATQILINAGIRVSSTVKEEYSNEVPKGKVVRTEPAIGSDVAKNTEVVLVISKGAKRRFIISCGASYNRNSYWSDILILLSVSSLLLFKRHRKTYIHN